EPLVMALPKLALGSYPPVRLPALEQALRTLLDKEAADPTLQPLPQQEQRFSGRGINIYGNSNASDKTPPRPEPAAAPGKPAGVLFPDYCLIRFCDVTVEPGKTYEFQVQMRLANPNYQKPELTDYPELAQVK